MASCSVPPQRTSRGSGDTYPTAFKHSFSLPQQQAPPHNIQSVQLHPKGKPGLPPVINLNSSQKLKLEFDVLAELNQQFKVEAEHRDKYWDKSSISPSSYLEGFSYSFIQNSQKSSSTRPVYHHTEFTFPNDRLKPAVSGNYMLNIYSYRSDELLFSMPFFVAEDQGSLQTSIENIYAKRKDGRSLAQPFSAFRYPKFVEFPQFDLSIFYTQNQFWGWLKEAGYIDTSTPDELHGHLDRDEAFIANYEFNVLDLRSFTPDQRQIIEFKPGQTPPEVILRRDVQNFKPNLGRLQDQKVGLANNNLGSNYARVAFSLVTNSSITADSDIYIVGDFNNWIISDLNKMSYDSGQKIWHGKALIKQGKYAYKYVIIRNNSIDDLAIDRGFTSSVQAYQTFIYFKDPKQHYDRLLKFNNTFSR